MEENHVQEGTQEKEAGPIGDGEPKQGSGDGETEEDVWMNKEGEELPRKRGGKLREMVNFLLYIVGIFLLTYVIIHYVGQRTQVSGSSMEHTLSDGDNLIVDKISYKFHSPERFDIIVFPYQHKEDTYYIKRIIGLPGETVQIDTAGNIYIDGEKLEESYGFEAMEDPGIAEEPITLGEDEYFVLGDNRNGSSDSRDPDVGIVQGESIIGRAWVRLYPFDRIGFLSHE